MSEADPPDPDPPPPPDPSPPPPPNPSPPPPPAPTHDAADDDARYQRYVERMRKEGIVPAAPAPKPPEPKPEPTPEPKPEPKPPEQRPQSGHWASRPLLGKKRKAS